MFDYRNYQGPSRWDEKQTDNKFYTDPGHGWYRVQHWMLFLLGDIGISQFSYMDTSHAYLEEDGDMARYLVAVTGSMDGAKEICKDMEDDYSEFTFIRRLKHFDQLWSHVRGKEQFEMIRSRGFSWNGEKLVPPTDFTAVLHIVAQRSHFVPEAEPFHVPEGSKMDCMNIYIPKHVDTLKMDGRNWYGMIYSPTAPIMEMPDYLESTSIRMAEQFIPHMESLGWNYHTLTHTPRKQELLNFGTLAAFREHIISGMATFIRTIHHAYQSKQRDDGSREFYHFDMGIWPLSARQSTKFSVIRRDINNNFHESWMSYPKAKDTVVTDDCKLTIFEVNDGKRYPIITYQLYTIHKDK